MTSQPPSLQLPWLQRPRVLALVGLVLLAGALGGLRLLGSQGRLLVAITSWPGYEYLYLAEQRRLGHRWARFVGAAIQLP